MSTISPGVRLHDRYVLVELIGAGGMSEVWRATDEVIGRPVAVKMLSAGVADPALQEATWREARAAGLLTHPNVTRIYDYGEATLPGGSHAPYLVMELVEGRSLAERLTAGPLPWREAARIGSQVAAALAAAHQVGVVHHDVKPGNVMLTADGAKVLDFGIAALVGATDQDMLVGTPTYAAPERLQRTPAHPANDVYSLGVLMYECLTGRPPARFATWAEAATAHRSGGPTPVPALDGVPSGLAELVRSCLSPDPAGRPEARETGARMARLSGGPDPTAAIPADQPTVATPLRYAVGSAAPVPAAGHTRIDHEPTRVPAPSRGNGRLMLAGIAVGVVVLALLAALVIAALRPGPDNGAGPPGEAGTPPPAGQASPPADRPSPTPEEDDEADLDIEGARATVRELDQAVTDALTEGRIFDPDNAEDLRSELREIDEELTAPGYDRDERIEKVRKAAEEFAEEVEDQLEDDEIHPSAANELLRLVRPLLTWSG